MPDWIAGISAASGLRFAALAVGAPCNDHSRVVERESVPPATSPWPVIVTAIITAGAAFLGVVVAQLWTSRREKRQWDHQMQMYSTQWEDQRERDAEQRADQRRRDRELWAREDQHRFTEYKRDLYARQIHAIRDLRGSVDEILSRVGFGLSEGQRPFNDIVDFLGVDLIEESKNLGSVASMTRDELSLVAPRPVERLAGEMCHVLFDARTEILVKEDWKAAHKKLGGFHLDKLKDAMRADMMGEQGTG